MIGKQEQELEEKNKEIVDSINYAKRIQDAMMTSEAYIPKVLFYLNQKMSFRRFLLGLQRPRR